MSKKRKKRKKPLARRETRMSRPQRLQSAKHWIAKYEGKDIVRSYKNWYKVDRLTAMIELKRCGYPIPDEKIAETKAHQARLGEQRKAKKAAALEESFPNEWRDFDFALILGYTSGGAAYGVTWEEWEEIEADMEREKEMQALRAEQAGEWEDDDPFAE